MQNKNAVLRFVLRTKINHGVDSLEKNIWGAF